MGKNSDDISNKFLLVLFFIVGGIFIGCVCFISGIIYAGTIHNDLECEKVPTIEKEEETSNILVVSDNSIKNKLIYKTNILLKGGNDFLFRNNISRLNDKERIEIVLEGTYRDDYLGLGDLNSEYNSLFNLDLDLDENKCYQIEKSKVVNKCPSYQQEYSSYIYEFLEDKDYYYVYLAFTNRDNTYEEDIFREINSDNYEEFNKYKVTYEKDGYNIYFYSIERI